MTVDIGQSRAASADGDRRHAAAGTVPVATSALRAAVKHLVDHTTSRTVLLIAADALEEASREIAVHGGLDVDLQTLATQARDRAATLPKDAP